MAGEMQVVVMGNLTSDPELRFTSNGNAVANFTIAQTPRTFNSQTKQWVDDETLWVRASVWRETAENVAETLTKGMRVIAYGRLRARSFETKDGQQRTNWELDVEEIGPSLKWATAQVHRKNSNGGVDPYGSAPSSSGWGQQQGQPQGQGQSQGGGHAASQHIAQQGNALGNASPQAASDWRANPSNDPRAGGVPQQNPAPNPNPGPFEGQEQVLSQGQGPWAGQGGAQDAPPPF